MGGKYKPKQMDRILKLQRRAMKVAGEPLPPLKGTDQWSGRAATSLASEIAKLLWRGGFSTRDIGIGLGVKEAKLHGYLTMGAPMDKTYRKMTQDELNESRRVATERRLATITANKERDIESGVPPRQNCCHVPFIRPRWYEPHQAPRMAQEELMLGRFRAQRGLGGYNWTALDSAIYQHRALKSAERGGLIVW